MRKPKYLITGTHYSGTTLVGKIISESKQASYIHEPFSRRTWAPLWFLYVSEINQEQYYDKIASIVHNRPEWRLFLGVDQLWSPPKVYARKLLFFFQAFRARHAQSAASVIKDPTALLMSDWISRTFEIPVVALIRHPGAFVESIVRKGADHPFNHFLEQQELMKTHFTDEEAVIREFCTSEKPLVEQGALLWKLLNKVLCSYAESNPLIKICRHEDIALQPETEFASIMPHLGMNYDEKTETTINSYCHSQNSARDATASGGLSRQYVKQNPEVAITKWTKRLAEPDIATIKTYTADIANKFYSDTEWNCKGI